MAELKPCPFCGKIPTVRFINVLEKYWVECDNKKCRIQPCTDAHKFKSVVVREWNRRVDNG
jgi:hypothetical protein